MLLYFFCYKSNLIIFLFSALSLKPDDPLVLKRRADVSGKLGNQKQAIQDYRYAIEIQSRMEESKT